MPLPTSPRNPSIQQVAEELRRIGFTERLITVRRTKPQILIKASHDDKTSFLSIVLPQHARNQTEKANGVGASRQIAV